MKKEIYIVYFNDEEIGLFEKKEHAKKYVQYLDFYSFNNNDKYYYRKGYIYV